jgi:hypothetical protein
MPSPLEKLKSGLKNQNWKLVSDAYFDLTNERIDVDAPKKSKSKALDKVLTKPEIMPNFSTTTTETGAKVEARPEAVRIGKRFNMFSDDGTESKELRGQ